MTVLCLQVCSMSDVESKALYSAKPVTDVPWVRHVRTRGKCVAALIQAAPLTGVALACCECFEACS
jgi:hypothetical protein